MKRIWVSLLIWGMLAAFGASGMAADFTLGELFRAKALLPPKREQELGRDLLKRTWDFAAQDKGNFTFFSDEVKDLRVTGEGALKFRMEADKVTLAWGNYQDKQPFKERIDLWPDYFTLKILARQSLDQESKWRVRLWSGGVIEKGWRPIPEQSLKGGEWQELSFASQGGMVCVPDCFDLEIEAAPGNEIEIKNLQITRQVQEGYFRKEFDLPPGEIWRATATVGNEALFYVNGKEVPSKALEPRPCWWGGSPYGAESVDLKPYLKPGKNCLGIYVFRHAYFQAQVVMRSGEAVCLDSDETWKWSPEPSPGWTKAGLDDRDWEAAPAAKWWGNFNYKSATERPAHDGYLVLENPYESKLFYSDAQPAIVQVRMPEGLAKRNPVVEWSAYRFQDRVETEIGSGKEDQCTKRGDSLIYQIRLGELPRGVYTIRTSLRLQGELVEERIPEPFVVVGKIPMKQVAGDSYEQGMELTLEDEIDFTNLKDPHPWMETDAKQSVTDPIIVERNGLKYRETRPNYSAQFSYYVEFKHPGDFYLMVMDYPDNQERWMGASCTAAWLGLESYAKCAPSVWTGFKQPASNTMRQLKWIYRPDPGGHAINVITIQKGGAAAAAKLKIYHIANRLPELEIANPQRRWLGIMTENLNPVNSFGVTFKSAREKVPDDPKAARDEDWQQRRLTKPVERICRGLEEWLDTCEHYAEYLRFTGQNLHVIGCYQYGDNNYGLQGFAGLATSRIPTDLRQVAVRVFRENGIDVLANIEFCYNTGLIRTKEGRANDAQVQWGADTIYMVDKNGKQRRGWGGQYGWNFLHPEVEETMLQVAEYMAEQFKDQPNFLGVHWLPYFGHNWLPTYRAAKTDQPMDTSYDDATIRRFEKDTGIKVPVSTDDPQRFHKRYLFLTSPAIKERWMQWRCEKIKQFFDKVAERIQRKRKDLDCVVNFYFFHAQEWKQSGLPLREFMREWGWDPKLYRDDKDVWMTHYMQATMWYARALRRTGWAPLWEQNVSPEFFDLYDAQTNRSVMIHHAWLEIEKAAATMPKREGWPRTFQSTTQAQAVGDYAREVFVQAMIGGDPQMVMFGFSHVSLMIGDEQPLREFVKVLRNLPPEKFQTALNTGLETNLAIRDLKKGGSYYFYVANPGYWPIRGSVALTGAGRVVDLAANRTVETRRDGGQTTVSVDLEPYGILAYRVEGGQAKVVSWKTEPVEEKHLAHLQAMVQKAEAMLNNSKALAALLPEEASFMRKAVAQAKADLAGGRYARAWATVTNWRFWILLYEQMETASQFGARFPSGGKPVDAAEPRALQVAWAKQAPKIDGKLDDAIWKQSQPTVPFLTEEKRSSIVSTRARMAYDTNNLYVAVECADPDPDSVQTKAQGEREVWGSGDDAVALLLQPDPEEATYYQMAVTAAGVKFDQRIFGGVRDYDFAPPWEVATTKAKERWIAEIAIPLSSLSATAGAGKVWRGNFFRRFRQDLVPSSYWSWTPGDLHDTTRFGELRFLSPS